MLMPRQAVPALLVPTLAHGAFDLCADAPQNFSLVVFYRGPDQPGYRRVRGRRSCRLSVRLWLTAQFVFPAASTWTEFVAAYFLHAHLHP